MRVGKIDLRENASYILAVLFGITVHYLMDIDALLALFISAGIIAMIYYAKKKGPKKVKKPSSNLLKKRYQIYKKSKGRSKCLKINSKQKKMLIFYILNKLDDIETVDAKNIAEEFNILREDMDEIVNFLDTHRVISVIYLPMTDFPVLRRGEKKAADIYKRRIFDDLSKTENVKDPDYGSFSREIREHLDSLRHRIK